MTQTTLLCRPADISRLGNSPEVQNLTPLEPGWITVQCEHCFQDVHMGVRQKTAYVQHPGKFDVVCFCCVTEILKAGPSLLRHLGGP